MNFELQSTEEEWKKVFFVGAGIYMATNVIFIIFGSGFVQKWNSIHDEVTPDDNKIEQNVRMATCSK